MCAKNAVACCLLFAVSANVYADESVLLSGRIVGAESGEPLPARVYIRSEDGKWFFARSTARDGSAVEYRKARSAVSVENHTTLSAHPFIASLPPGHYTVTVERGKEYLPQTKTVRLDHERQEISFQLRRWIDMNRLGWYSGETHVHRSPAELPNLMLAEHLNVALPLTYWVTKSDTPPAQGGKNSPRVKAELIRVDATHVIYPMNTEYEIFTVGGKRHTLGAVFALNHKNALQMGAPPVRPIAEQVRREGGLLELDKHNWPWSMMLVPVMNVDLYELTNNHIWRTDFHFRGFGSPPPAYMKVESDENGMTERGWIDFTFRNYYALLNCGFRMRPTAGTASGVHPVPLGYGRVYVYCGDKFSYDAWIDGLDKGRSFVTTGPMIGAKMEGQRPGHMFGAEERVSRYGISGWVRGDLPITKIELVAAGEVVQTLKPENRPMKTGGFEASFDFPFQPDGSTWVAVRCWQPTASGRVRFAHTAPWHVDIPGKPLRPREQEVGYLIDRVESEIERNRGVLSHAAMEEFGAALEKFKSIANTAR